MKLNTIAPFSLLLALTACGDAQTPASLKEAWDVRNDPRIMNSDYELNIDHLPSVGRVSGEVWADDYWASKNGGISYRWQTQEISYPLQSASSMSAEAIARLSPAEKFDLYRGDGRWDLTLSERARTHVLATVPGSAAYIPGFSIPGWEGLCHGWAPASMLYKEPKAVVVKNPQGQQISFSSSDIKALLTLNIHLAAPNDKRLVGARCEDSAASAHISCRDANAASFHLILTNEVGVRKKSFVVDVVASEQVWNHPVLGFTTKVQAPVAKASPGAAPGTKFEAEVETDMVFLVESAPNAQAHGVNNHQFERTKHYRYVLELDASKSIIGGRWLQDDHPDFIWRQNTPNLSPLLSGLDQLYKSATGEALPLSNDVPSTTGTDETWGVPTPPASDSWDGTGSDWNFN
jgi:hypothetical protein